MKLIALHRIKGIKPDGEYVEPKEGFEVEDPKEAQNLIKAKAAIPVAGESAEAGADLDTESNDGTEH